MIRTLRLENYRGFEEYELSDLARVNLLVGRNDCGKSSVLEAVELLASRGDPRVLVESMRRRGEAHIKYPLMPDGALAGSPSAPARTRRSWQMTSPPTQFVTAGSLRAREMAGLWNQVLVAGRESEVVRAMRILQPELDSIHFLTGDAARGADGIVLGFGAGSPRAPIADHGDGMRRLLALWLSLAGAAGGFLLIDEIDTGLHWTVMEDVWKLVVTAAMEASIQVFATSHSLDCIVGLASLVKDRPDSQTRCRSRRSSGGSTTA